MVERSKYSCLTSRLGHSDRTSTVAIDMTTEITSIAAIRMTVAECKSTRRIRR